MSSSRVPGSVAGRVGYALKRAQHALRTRMDDALRPIGLTAPQYAVLSAVEAEAGISNARLARAAFVTPQSMQGILANLERGGLLARQADPDHGRILRNGLTDQGKNVLATAHQLVKVIEDVMLSSIGHGQAPRFAETLSRCADDLGAK